MLNSEYLPTLRTFYNWLYLGLLEYHQYNKARKSKTSKFNDSNERVNIIEREIDFGFKQNDYTKVGHYEVDTVVNRAIRSIINQIGTHNILTYQQ